MTEFGTSGVWARRNAESSWWLSAVVGLALLLSAGLLPTAAMAQKGEDVTKPGRLLGIDLNRTDAITRAQKKYAKTVAEDMVCLCGTCPKEPLSTCDCAWAGRGRKTIELALLDGHSEDAVLDAFRKAFGDKVFALPPANIETLLTGIPFMLIVVMLMVMVGYGLRSQMMRAKAPVPVRKPGPTTHGEEDEAARILRRELEEMD